MYGCLSTVVYRGPTTVGSTLGTVKTGSLLIGKSYNQCYQFTLLLADTYPLFILL